MMQRNQLNYFRNLKTIVKKIKDPTKNNDKENLKISIELLEQNEIIPLTLMFEETFKEGYNFIYSYYIKE